MPTYNQPSFQEFRQQISIIELALHVGYEWQPKKGKTMPVLYHAGLDDHIVIKNPKDSGSQVYFQTGSYTDRGTLINFVSNRLTTCFNRFNDPTRSQAQCINDVLKDYAGIIPDRKQAIRQLENHIHRQFTQAATEKEFSAEQYKLSPLPTTNYLTQERYILPDLLNSAQFQGTVATQRLYFADGKPVSLAANEPAPPGQHVLENIAFPYIPRDGEPMIGLEIRAATFKHHAAGSDRRHGIWISNPNPTPTLRLVVGESAIDLLSFRQLELSTGLHPQADSRYASIGGSLSPEQLTTLAQFMEPATQLVLGFDNDDKGARYALSVLTALSAGTLSLTQASQHGFIALQIASPQLQTHFSTLTAEHNAAMQTYMPRAGKEVQQDLDKNMFYWRQDTVTPTLEIPITNTALLNVVNNQLLEHGQFTRSVAIVRPRGKDFNEDLKSEQLRLVRRPVLLINPAKGQIVSRFATEEQARQYIDNDLPDKNRPDLFPVGTQLYLVQSGVNQLIPRSLGNIRLTATGVEKTYVDASEVKAISQHTQPKQINEQRI